MKMGCDMRDLSYNNTFSFIVRKVIYEYFDTNVYNSKNNFENNLKTNLFISTKNTWYSLISI